MAKGDQPVIRPAGHIRRGVRVEVVELDKAEQLGLFGAGVQEVAVRGHVRRTPHGVAPVVPHVRHQEAAAPAPARFQLGERIERTMGDGTVVRGVIVGSSEPDDLGIRRYHVQQDEDRVRLWWDENDEVRPAPTAPVPPAPAEDPPPSSRIADHPTDARPGQIHYTLRSTEESSHKFGPCEVCGKRASEVYSQTALVAYFDDVKKKKLSWTQHQAPPTLFGHQECLEAARIHPGRGSDPDHAVLRGGMRVQLRSGRFTEPAPGTAGSKVTPKQLRQVDEWLVRQALNEATARNDDFNVTAWQQLVGRKLSDGDRDSLNEYLFGAPPDVYDLRKGSRLQPTTSWDMEDGHRAVWAEARRGGVCTVTGPKMPLPLRIFAINLQEAKKLAKAGLSAVLQGKAPPRGVFQADGELPLPSNWSHLP